MSSDDSLPAYVVVEAESDTAWVAHIRGELDMASSEWVAPSLIDAIAASRTLMIDLSELTFCDSTGLSVLIIAGEKARAEGGSVSFRGLRPHVRRLFEITGVDRTLDIRDGNGSA